MRVFHIILFVAGISLLSCAQSAPAPVPDPKPVNPCAADIASVSKDLSIDYGHDKESIFREHDGIKADIDKLNAMSGECKEFYSWHEVMARAYLLYGINYCDQGKFLNSNRMFYMVYENCLKLSVQAEKDGLPDIRDAFLFYAQKAQQLHSACEARAVKIATPAQLTRVSGQAIKR